MAIKAFKQNAMYVVEMDDDDWYGGDCQRHVATAQQEAKACSCSILAVFSIPDPVFPMNGHDARHRVHHEVFKDTGNSPVQYTAQFTCTVSDDHYEGLSEQARLKFLRNARDQLNMKANGVAGRYQIVTLKGRSLETGRV